MNYNKSQFDVRRHGAVSLAIFSEKCRLNPANIERFTSECVLGIPRIILISIPTTRTDTVSHASVACRRGTSASRFRTNFGYRFLRGSSRGNTCFRTFVFELSIPTKIIEEEDLLPDLRGVLHIDRSKKHVEPKTPIFTS